MSPALASVHRTGGALLSLALAAGLVTGLPGDARADVVPPTPPGLPAGVEDFQPYVGQAGCDPVAKPGVAAFQTLLMDTYRDTGSSGIVRDCGTGSQSEHKEGRAFDWTVSADNPNHVLEVRAVTTWLTEPVDGVPAARARRLGLMYMIWNRQIWRAYEPDDGWQPYDGWSPHTDHVHFSFGWNGAQQDTSWWTGVVAPVDYGPYASGGEGPRTSPTPARSPENLRVLAAYGSTTVGQGSTGSAVVALQTALGVTADGSFGPVTEAAVRAFQADEGLRVDGAVGPDDWRRLFLRPVDPFGAVEQLSTSSVRGWVADVDRAAPLRVQVLLDGVPQGPARRASAPRPDVAGAYPGATAFGYDLAVDVPPGTHEVCVVATNAGPGADARTGCGSVALAVDTTGDGRWIAAMYRDVLGRPPEPGALELRYAQLRDRTAGGRPALAAALVRSAENLDQEVATLYATVLGRAASPGERAGWVALLARGVPLSQVAAVFAASAERVAPGSGAEAYVAALYPAVLGRAADPAGQAAWARQVRRQGRLAVARAVLASPESLGRRVQSLYATLLGRPADPGGLAGWSARMSARGDLTVAEELLVSAEYDARAQAG